MHEIRKDSQGTKWYYTDGLLHREDGPAVLYADGSESWFMNGVLHRTGGPARDWVYGNEEWYQHGKPYQPSAHELMDWKMIKKQKQLSNERQKNR